MSVPDFLNVKITFFPGIIFERSVFLFIIPSTASRKGEQCLTEGRMFAVVTV